MRSTIFCILFIFFFAFIKSQTTVNIYNNGGNSCSCPGLDLNALVERVELEYINYLNSGQFDALDQLNHPDILSLVGGTQILRGRAEVRASNTASYNDGWRTELTIMSSVINFINNFWRYKKKKILILLFPKYSFYLTLNPFLSLLFFFC